MPGEMTRRLVTEQRHSGSKALEAFWSKVYLACEAAVTRKSRLAMVCAKNRDLERGRGLSGRLVCAKAKECVYYATVHLIEIFAFRCMTTFLLCLISKQASRLPYLSESRLWPPLGVSSCA